MVEGRIEKEAPLWLFLQGTNLMTEGSTLLNSLPLQSLPPDTPTLGIRTSTDVNIPFPTALLPCCASSHPSFLGFPVSLYIRCSLCLGHMFPMYFHVLRFCDIVQLLAQMSPLEGPLLIAFSKNHPPFILNLCSLEHCHCLALHNMSVYILHVCVELGFPQRSDHLLTLRSL